MNLKYTLRKLQGSAQVRTDLAEVRAQIAELDVVRQAVGRVESRQNHDVPPGDLHAAEFQVYSQWGEDGILDHLLRHVRTPSKTFVEFGVQDYTEANTRFLLMQGGWRGLVMDGDADNVERIRASPVHWRFDLTAKQAFVTADNIDEVLLSAGFQGEIALLSIDIDGNDYWVWNAMEAITPTIVVCEYNARFGSTASVVVPYRSDFRREAAHYSHLYFGASLGALVKLAERKDMCLIGCGSSGVNGFFVRRDALPAGWRALTSYEAFVPVRHREARGEDGALSYISSAEENQLLQGLPLVEV